MTSEEKSAWAGEYVLGTLPEVERRTFERALAGDPELAALLRDWQARLAPLDDAVAPVRPPASAWSNIAAAVGESAPRPLANDPVAGLRRRLSAWKAATLMTGVVAAGLAVLVVTGPPTNPTPPGQQYVAVVSRGGDLPALLVNVDLATGTVAVRSVAAEAQPGRSNELWYIGDGEPPLSLGVVDHVGEEIVVPVDRIPDFRPMNAVFAITDEPLGGSPTGAPTGEVIYTGTLLQAPD